MGNCKSSRMYSRSYDAVLEQRIEQQRQEGQEVLRSMVLVSEEDIDWGAVIRKANELHAQEQSWMRKRNLIHDRSHKSTKRALRQRKQFDEVGSFSINLLTLRAGDDSPSILRGCSRTSTSDESFHDCHSTCSNATNGFSHSSNDLEDISEYCEERGQEDASLNDVRTTSSNGFTVQSYTSWGSTITKDSMKMLNTICSDNTMDPIDEQSQSS